jgi:hypothetical protein
VAKGLVEIFDDSLIAAHENAPGRRDEQNAPTAFVPDKPKFRRWPPGRGEFGPFLYL